ncbi:MAG TPA: FAD-dependent oxidoreductase, partial [Pyrinomonadaceae bacterium]|nr:FAD-dependent oxidoreductase [Pyrinomonadaceae bacterium]
MSKPLAKTAEEHEGEPEQTLSVWTDTAAIPLETPLTERITADVCVVGAGIAGMTTAYLLAREGKSVVVLDDGPIGGG